MNEGSGTVCGAQQRADSPGKAKRLDRRIARLRQAGVLEGPGDNITIERAVTVEDFREAYGLVYEAFLEEGFIEPNHYGMRVRAYEASPEMATFVAKAASRVVATMSLVTDSSDLGLPADHAFGSELDSLRAQGRRIGEITSNAVAPDYRNGLLFLELTRACFAHAQAAGCDDVFACITPKHARFFSEFLQFVPWGSRRSYSQENEDIVEGYRLDIQWCQQQAGRTDEISAGVLFLVDLYFTQNPYHRYVNTWSIKADRFFADPVLLRALYVDESGLLSRCDAEERQAIERRWGAEVFSKVWSADGAAVMAR